MRVSALTFALLGLTTAQAFVLPAPAPAHRQRVAPVRMGFFDALKKGFENEAQSTPAPNAGLKNVRIWGASWFCPRMNYGVWAWHGGIFHSIAPSHIHAHQAPPMVTITFMPANKKVEAVVGQNLRDVAAAARIPIKYNCKKGYVRRRRIVNNTHDHPTAT